MCRCPIIWIFDVDEFISRFHVREPFKICVVDVVDHFYLSIVVIFQVRWCLSDFGFGFGPVDDALSRIEVWGGSAEVEQFPEEGHVPLPVFHPQYEIRSVGTVHCDETVHRPQVDQLWIRVIRGYPSDERVQEPVEGDAGVQLSIGLQISGIQPVVRVPHDGNFEMTDGKGRDRVDGLFERQMGHIDPPGFVEPPQSGRPGILLQQPLVDRRPARLGYVDEYEFQPVVYYHDITFHGRSTKTKFEQHQSALDHGNAYHVKVA